MIRQMITALVVMCLNQIIPASVVDGQSTIELAPSSATAQGDNNDVRPLGQGVVIEREMTGGETHAYRLTLAAGQYVYAVVNQKGIDVVVRLIGPDGKQIVEVDSPNGAEGPEPISAVIDASGSYQLEVRSLDKQAKPGRYEVKIEELRIATAEDRNRVAAEQMLREAELQRGLRTAESFRKSAEKYKEALPLYRAAGDRKEEARILTTLGRLYDDLGEKNKALEYLDQALPIHRELSNRTGEALTLNYIAVVYKDLGEQQKALDYLNQALPINRGSNDRRGEAVTLHNMGLVYSELGEKQKALDYFGQALVLHRAVGNRRGEGIMISSIGSIYAAMGEKRKALDYLNQSLPILRSINERSLESRVLSNIGHLYESLDEHQKALDFYNQAIVVERAVGDRMAEGATIHNIAGVYQAFGEYQKAIEFYNQALRLHRDVKYRTGEAIILSNLGGVYRSLGDYDKALDFYNQALPLHQAVRNRGSEAATLENIGSLSLHAGDKEKALDLLNQALALRRAVAEPAGEASALNNLGLVYSSMREYQKALDLFNQAVQLQRRLGSRRGEALVLCNTGRVYAALGEQGKALDLYAQALPLFHAFGDRSGEAQALNLMARAEHDRGNFAEARSHIDAALDIVESLRTKVFSQELRASYLASVKSYYDLYIDSIMQLHKQRPSEGYEVAALQASERARARSLLEMLTEANADIRQGVDPTLLERERALQRLLNTKANRQRQISKEKPGFAEAAAIAKEIDSTAIEYQNVEAEIRATSPRYAALTQPLTLSLKDIQQQVLDPDTLILEYALGDERSYLWAVSPTSIASYELPKRAEVEAAARRFYELIKSNAENQEATQAADLLSQMLLSPVAAQLGTKRLVIVADGTLQYVPFGSLSVPELRRQDKGDARLAGGYPSASASARPPRAAAVPLIVEHEIVSLPSASTLAVLRRETSDRKPAPKAVAVLADPVFASDDARVETGLGHRAATAGAQGTQPSRDVERSGQELGVTGADLRFPRLLGTRREAEAVLALVPDGERKRALDFEASRATATSAELGQYRSVLFATHALLNNNHPELSGIVLSLVDERGQAQDGFLRLNEIYNLRLSADLVVLSACQTGLGKEIKGEGLVGLTRGFMYAGAPRVVASLWKVDDKATSELMKVFFQGMLGEKRLRPAEALRAAQIAMWKQKQWRSPYYWAAFVMQGEWK